MTYNYYQGVTRSGFSRLAAIGVALAASVVLALGLASPTFAQATGNYSYFGSAQQQPDGVHLYSNASQPYSGINFELEPGTTVSDLDSLAATFEPVEGTCVGGAPRFSVETAQGNIFVYFGDAPNFNTCSGGPTGNLIDDEDSRVDTSQIPGGTQYDTWAHAEALVGSEEITGLSLVVDAGWAGNQEFAFSSANINETNYNFTTATSKEQCKDGGWMNFADDQGNAFKNQGQCVSYVNHHDGNGADDVNAVTRGNGRH